MITSSQALGVFLLASVLAFCVLYLQPYRRSNILSLQPCIYSSETNVSDLLLTSDEALSVFYGQGNSVFNLSDVRYRALIMSYLVKPSQGKRKVGSPGHDYSEFRKSSIIDTRLKQRRRGFYVEAGAADGSSGSTTLFFEATRDWDGLLVEANENFYKTMLSTNRQAYMMRGCLSASNRSGLESFSSAGFQGGLSKELDLGSKEYMTAHRTFQHISQVHCFPLTEILSVLRVNHVDFLSLDVQGAELDILKTIDLKKLRVDVIVMEYVVLGHDDKTAVKLAEMRSYMNKTLLYREVTTLGGWDVMFERIDL